MITKKVCICPIVVSTPRNRIEGTEMVYEVCTEPYFSPNGDQIYYHKDIMRKIDLNMDIPVRENILKYENAILLENLTEDTEGPIFWHNCVQVFEGNPFLNYASLSFMTY